MIMTGMISQTAWDGHNGDRDGAAQDKEKTNGERLMAK